MVNIVGVLVVLLTIGVAWITIASPFMKYTEVYKEWDKAKENATYTRGVAFDKPEPKAPNVFGGVVVVILLVVFLVGLSSGSTYIPPTYVGVLENTATGQLKAIGPGTYIFGLTGFEPVPFISKVTKYNTQRHIIEIGEPIDGQKIADGKSETQFFGVPSASNSPGQPIVYYRARGWAYPNVKKIVELHRRYGSGYQTNWVEAQWTTALKNVQRVSAYDAVKSNPISFQERVEESLQEHLNDIDGEPLVFVSQLAIIDYDYDSVINEYLRSIANKSLEQSTQEQQLLVNQLQQQAEIVRVQTAYSVTLRTAEAESAKLAAEADGRATATKLAADAEAYRITAAYNAEASGIAMVIKNFGSVDAYNEYKRITEWNGELPQYYMSNGVLPFFNVPVQ